MIYKMLLALIAANRLDGIEEKIQTFLDAGKLTQAQADHLLELVKRKREQ